MTHRECFDCCSRPCTCLCSRCKFVECVCEMLRQVPIEILAQEIKTREESERLARSKRKQAQKLRVQSMIDGLVAELACPPNCRGVGEGGVCLRCRLLSTDYLSRLCLIELE